MKTRLVRNASRTSIPQATVNVVIHRTVDRVREIGSFEKFVIFGPRFFVPVGSGDSLQLRFFLASEAS